MDAAKLLEAMSADGFTVEFRDGRIQVSPAGRITDDLRTLIRSHRDSLARLLQSTQAEAAELLEHLRAADPSRWSDADVAEAANGIRRDYPAGITCLRTLVREAEFSSDTGPKQGTRGDRHG
jgi:hypothetical protein